MPHARFSPHSGDPARAFSSRLREILAPRHRQTLTGRKERAVVERIPEAVARYNSATTARRQFCGIKFYWSSMDGRRTRRRVYEVTRVFNFVLRVNGACLQQGDKTFLQK